MERAGSALKAPSGGKRELGGFGHNIASWGGRCTTPEPDDRLAQFPYLAPDFSLVEKVAGRTPWI